MLAMIRHIRAQDIPAILAIYNFYIKETVATFEVAPVSEDDILERVTKVRAASLPWLVAENEQGQTLGYAYASPWKERFAYRHSVEITVYLRPDALRLGLGSRLYQALFDELKQRPINAVLAGITLPNEASVALHEKFGMKQVAQFKQVGFKFDRWLDTGYWQVMLRPN